MSSTKSLADFISSDEEERLAQELSLKISLDAIAERTSDIHMEPFQQEGIIKFRIDGLLQETSRHPMPALSSIQRIIKKAAALDPDLCTLPQEGRLILSTDRIAGKAETYTMRVATFPTSFGERMVIRIVDPGNLSFLKGDLEALGLNEKEMEMMKGIIQKPYGLIIFTGPSGCGKTTTAYASLGYEAERTKGKCSIISLEDPIEYPVEGIMQTQVDSRGEFNYSKALKSIMAQDPDIIYCGEIQNAETARMLVMIASAGHLVLSQLHRTDVAGALKLLIELGIEPYLLAMTIAGLIAQRLVRKICPHCREEVKNDRKIFERYREEADDIDSLGLTYRGRGCGHCRNSGYRGRTALYEILPERKGIEEILSRDLSIGGIRKELKALGIETLRQKAIEKAAMGITTLEEAIWCSGV